MGGPEERRAEAKWSCGGGGVGGGDSCRDSDERRRENPRECGRWRRDLHLANSIEATAGGETVSFVLHFEDADWDEASAGDSVRTLVL